MLPDDDSPQDNNLPQGDDFIPEPYEAHVAWVQETHIRSFESIIGGCATYISEARVILLQSESVCREIVSAVYDEIPRLSEVAEIAMAKTKELIVIPSTKATPEEDEFVRQFFANCDLVNDASDTVKPVFEEVFQRNNLLAMGARLRLSETQSYKDALQESETNGRDKLRQLKEAIAEARKVWGLDDEDDESQSE